MADRRMFRYEIPIDDQAHVVPLSHTPVAVAAVAAWFAVEFWCESTKDAPAGGRAFQVFSTGQPLPDGAKWVGTCPRTEDGLVWHLYEVPRG
jgi:hypothetical protein